jgi:hypothetical protein
MMGAKSNNSVPPNGEILLYETADGHTRVECRFVDETLWHTQALIAELFQKNVRTINEHLGNIFDEGELDPGSVIRNFRITASDTVAPELRNTSMNGLSAFGTYGSVKLKCTCGYWTHRYQDRDAAALPRDGGILSL